MLGQSLVEPELELEPEPALGAAPPAEFVELPELVLEPEGAELVAPEPELPEEAVPGVVEVDEPEPEVAALATSAPPPTRPALSAPAATTLRNRICIGSA